MTTPCIPLHCTLLRLSEPVQGKCNDAALHPIRCKQIWMSAVFFGDEQLFQEFCHRHRRRREFTDTSGIMLLAAGEFLQVDLTSIKQYIAPSGDHQAGHCRPL